MSEDNKNTAHEPVLLQEVLGHLNIQPTDTVFDGTAGGGGHSLAIGLILDAGGTLIACDLNQDALNTVEQRLTDVKAKVHYIKNNFRHLSGILDTLGITQVSKVLFDLGLSSDELEASGRGFSFKKLEEPLLMTFDNAPTEGTITAQTVVNEWGESSIADIIYGFGGERRSRGIAKAIVEARKVKPIETVGDLVSIIEKATGGKKGRIHPATKTFQALRMAVNDETGSLGQGLIAALDRLSVKGRLAIITFESITDRLVKRAFIDAEKKGWGTIQTKKPITPSDEEIARNPRARSAKLRIFEKS